MNLISIITQYDPSYNYYSLFKQSWTQIELVFGVEKEYIDEFLKKSIDFDIPYKYVINRKNNFSEVINIADSYFVLFMLKDEIWSDNYLALIKQFFMERQDLGKSLKSNEQINVDPLAVNRNIFYFLGKSNNGTIVKPIMFFNEALHHEFSLWKIIKKPIFFQPSIKFLLPMNFIKDNYIEFKAETDNNPFNIALYYLDVLTYLYKSNNYFEPKYFGCYLDFEVKSETISLQIYEDTYNEHIKLKKEIFEGDKSSYIYQEFKKIK
jgi:hypothetical protein